MSSRIMMPWVCLLLVSLLFLTACSSTPSIPSDTTTPAPPSSQTTTHELAPTDVAATPTPISVSTAPPDFVVSDVNANSDSLQDVLSDEEVVYDETYDAHTTYEAKYDTSDTYSSNDKISLDSTSLRRRMIGTWRGQAEFYIFYDDGTFSTDRNRTGIYSLTEKMLKLDSNSMGVYIYTYQIDGDVLTLNNSEEYTRNN